MFTIKVNNNPSRYFDATETLGTISELTEAAVAEFIAEMATKGPRFANATIIHFEIDEDNEGCADAAVNTGSNLECFSIEAA